MLTHRASKPVRVSVGSPSRCVRRGERRCFRSPATPRRGESRCLPALRRSHLFDCIGRLGALRISDGHPCWRAEAPRAAATGRHAHRPPAGPARARPQIRTRRLPRRRRNRPNTPISQVNPIGVVVRVKRGTVAPPTVVTRSPMSGTTVSFRRCMSRPTAACPGWCSPTAGGAAGTAAPPQTGAAHRPRSARRP